MLKIVLNEMKTRRNISIIILIFLTMLALYTIMDNFGYQTYTMLGDAFGYRVVYQTITLNLLISIFSAFTITLSIINYRLHNTKSGGSVLSTIPNIFALIFSGCSSCGISILSAIGLSVGLPTILPGAVKFKFLALLLILLSLIWVTYLIQFSTCKVKLEDNNEQ